MVTSGNRIGTITRNSSYFKEALSGNDDEETSDGKDIDILACQSEAAPIEDTDLPHYPKRARKRLVRYDAQLQ